MRITMKTTKYKTSKRRVMQYAWEMKKGKTGWAFTFSQCLVKAWAVEKINVERWNNQYEIDNCLGRYTAENIAKLKASIPKHTVDLSYLANTLTNYYSNNMYNGD